MLPKSIGTAVLAALEDLVEGELEKFLSQLLDRDGKRIASSFVIGKSRVEIKRALIQTYTEEGALEVVLETLQDAGFDQKAQTFEKNTRHLTKKKCDGCGASGAVAGACVPASAAVEEPDCSEDPALSYIRNKKMNLIKCLGANLFILQLAHQDEVITDGDYRRIKTINSQDAAVTELIDVVMDKGPDHRRRFLKVLKQDHVVETYPQLKEIMKDWK